MILCTLHIISYEANIQISKIVFKYPKLYSNNQIFLVGRINFTFIPALTRTQTDRQTYTDRHTAHVHRQTDRQACTDSTRTQTDRQACTDRQTDRQTHTHTQTDIQHTYTDRQTAHVHRQTYSTRTQTDRQACTDRHTAHIRR